MCTADSSTLQLKAATRTKTMGVVNSISHRQLYRNSLCSTRMVFKVVWLLQGCLNLLYSVVKHMTLKHHYNGNWWLSETNRGQSTALHQLTLKISWESQVSVLNHWHSKYYITAPYIIIAVCLFVCNGSSTEMIWPQKTRICILAMAHLN